MGDSASALFNESRQNFWYSFFFHDLLRLIVLSERSTQGEKSCAEMDDVVVEGVDLEGKGNPSVESSDPDDDLSNQMDDRSSWEIDHDEEGEEEIMAFE